MGIPVRQPLASVTFTVYTEREMINEQEFADLIAEELNVKKTIFILKDKDGNVVRKTEFKHKSNLDRLLGI